jgi:hypothetical protein
VVHAKAGLQRLGHEPDTEYRLLGFVEQFHFSFRNPQALVDDTSLVHVGPPVLLSSFLCLQPGPDWATVPGSMNGRQLVDEALKLRPSLKTLFTSGYTENAIVHHGRLDSGVLLLAKPYRKADLARMIRRALTS